MTTENTRRVKKVSAIRAKALHLKPQKAHHSHKKEISVIDRLVEVPYD